MSEQPKWTRWATGAGFVFLALGGADPLEGSVGIALGSALIALGWMVSPTLLPRAFL